MPRARFNGVQGVAGSNPAVPIESTRSPVGMWLDRAFSSAAFAPTGLVDLTLPLATINAWNRLAIAFPKLPV